MAELTEKGDDLIALASKRVAGATSHQRDRASLCAGDHARESARRLGAHRDSASRRRARAAAAPPRSLTGSCGLLSWWPGRLRGVHRSVVILLSDGQGNRGLVDPASMKGACSRTGRSRDRHYYHRHRRRLSGGPTHRVVHGWRRRVPPCLRAGRDQRNRNWRAGGVGPGHSAKTLVVAGSQRHGGMDASGRPCGAVGRTRHGVLRSYRRGANRAHRGPGVGRLGAFPRSGSAQTWLDEQLRDAKSESLKHSS